MSINETLLNFNAIEQKNTLDEAISNRKKFVTDYYSPQNKEPKKVIISKAGQSPEMCQSDDDMCNNLPEHNYWNLQAEKTRIELKDALDENERLHKIKEALIKKNLHYQQILEEANCFIDVFKEVLDSNDDTGVDLEYHNDSRHE